MVVELNKLNNLLSKHYSVFIASASYEDRSLSILNSIADEINFDYRLVSLSIPHKKLMQHNLDIFERQEFSVIEIDNGDQVQTFSNFFTKLTEIINTNPNSSFLIDITTFTRQTLLILFRILRNLLTSKNQVQYVYAHAKEYSIGLPYKEKWLTRGILEVNSVFGYSGIIRPSRPYHLVVLMGFETERASSLITAYEPSKITLGYAKKEDSLSEENFELNKQKVEELLIEFPNIESFEFSCMNILNCKEEILDQVNKHKAHNIIISPMNNKISTLSCALAAFDNNEIQIATAIAAIYNYENYSLAGANCSIIEMPDFIKTN